MDKQDIQRLKLGIFVVAGITIFLIFAYFIGNQSNIWGKNTEIFVVFDNINGLKVGNNVRYSGMNSGSVTNIYMANDSEVVVTISLEKNIIKFINKDAKAAITTDGLVGNMVVNIVSGGSTGEVLSKGDTLKSFTRIRTDEVLQTLSVTNENAALLTAELLKISKEISSGNGIIHQLLSDPIMAKDMKITIQNLKEASVQSSKTIQNINKMVNSFDNKNNLLGTIKDTATASRVKRIIMNLDYTSQNIGTIVDNINATVGNANQTISNIRNGKGAINYLSNDPNLVTQIEQTISHIDTTILQLNNAGILLNQNLEALKHNWLLRGYFEKQEKEKLKAIEKNKKKN